MIRWWTNLSPLSQSLLLACFYTAAILFLWLL